MAMTNAERQVAFKEKMYAAGYKQKIVWVPRETEGRKVSFERKTFLLRLEAITVGLSKTKLNKLFGEVLKIVKTKVKEEKKGSS